MARERTAGWMRLSETQNWGLEAEIPSVHSTSNAQASTLGISAKPETVRAGQEFLGLTWCHNTPSPGNVSQTIIQTLVAPSIFAADWWGWRGSRGKVLRREEVAVGSSFLKLSCISTNLAFTTANRVAD